MADYLTEALLEMHYHKALVELFEQHFGVRFLRLLKPSQNDEAFLGFDQGWVSSKVRLDDLTADLKDGIQSGANAVATLFLGYFLQFKKVEEAHKSKFMPTGFTAPYYRVEVSLKPNKTTGKSQHETLLLLQSIAGADVNYACPMVFELDVYAEASLDDLRIVPVADAPTGYATNERHFITFQKKTDTTPTWCSEPVKGRALSVIEWLRSDRMPRLLNRAEFRAWLEKVRTATRTQPMPALFGEAAAWPESLTIVAFSNQSLRRGESHNPAEN